SWEQCRLLRVMTRAVELEMKMELETLLSGEIAVWNLQGMSHRLTQSYLRMLSASWLRLKVQGLTSFIATSLTESHSTSKQVNQALREAGMNPLPRFTGPSVAR